MTLCKGDKLGKVRLGKQTTIETEQDEYHLVQGEAYHIWEVVDLSACYGSPTEVFQIVVLKKVK